MTNLDSLKKLYADLGGTPSDVANMTTSAEVIEALSAVAGGGGGGSSKTLLVTVTLVKNQSITCNTRFSTIVDAIKNKYVIYCHFVSNGEYNNDIYMNLQGLYNNGEHSTALNSYTIIFGSMLPATHGSQNCVYTVVSIDYDNTKENDCDCEFSENVIPTTK